MLKAHSYPRSQQRSSKNSPYAKRVKVHSCFSSLIDYHLVNDTALQFSEDNTKLVEGLYELHLETFSSSDSDDDNDHHDRFNKTATPLMEIKEV